jgi:triphosphoribosyl-dephospho-CoA synthase
VTKMPAAVSRPSLADVDIATAAQLACLLEVSAPKPGNVSPGRHFTDIRYEDFLASAVAIGAPLGGAASRGIGATVRMSIEATARWTRSNTNLGIVLLLAPLARAALISRKGVGSLFPADHEQKTPDPFSSLRQTLRAELAATTVNDAREAYAAIRLASPGGLGKADAQDVADEPTVSLLDAMRLAADRDGIAREYATGFEVTFGTAAPTLDKARAARLTWDDAIVETFLTLLAAGLDTHIVRRSGRGAAAAVTERARAALAAGGVRSPEGRLAIEEMDRALRDPRNSGNPGTTADLTAAAIFVVLIGRGWGPADGGEHAAAR